LDEALADLNQAIALVPQRSGPYRTREAVRSKQGDLDGALADFQRALELGEHRDDTYNRRGAARSCAGDREGASADDTEAIKLLSRPLYLGYRASCRVERYQDATDAGQEAFREDLELAIADLHRGPRAGPAEAWPATLAVAHLLRGDAQRNPVAWEMAADDYTEAVALGMTNPDAFYGRGAARAQPGDDKGAVEDLNTGLDATRSGASSMPSPRSLGAGPVPRHSDVLRSTTNLAGCRPRRESGRGRWQTTGPLSGSTPFKPDE
jgi:tetratricopeptide (TPR) repeat protein